MLAVRSAGQHLGMLNPLSLPNDVLAALRSVTNIERLLDERLADAEERLGQLDARIERLPADLERTLRPHLERQNASIEKLHPELVANREHAEQLPGKVDGLRDEIRAVFSELNEVRETVEPLQGPAERVAKLSERLPGGN
jgi:chromosome segregation ATPase